MEKLTNLQILNILTALEGEGGLLSANTKLPVKFLWNLKVNVENLSKIREKIQAMDKEINECYANDDMSYEVETENGVQRQVREEFLESFINERRELFEIETEVEIRKVPFEYVENLELSVAEFSSIAFMLSENE